MAENIELEKLQVVWEANLKRMEREISRGMNSIEGRVNKYEKRAQQSFRRVEKSADRMGRRIGQAVSAAALAVAGRAILSYEETWRNATNTIGQYTDVLGEAGKATSDLNAVANDAGVRLAALGNLTGAAARSARGLGKSGADVLQFGNNVAKGSAIANNGAAAVDGAMIQLAQAIGSPRVQLQEFNSVIEGTPRLAQAFADGVEGANGSIAKLRELIAGGDVSGGQLFDAILSQTEKLNAEFASLEQGPTEALNRLNNKLAEFLGTNEAVRGAAQSTAAAIEFVADNLDTLADAVIVASAGLAGLLGAKALVGVTAALAGAATGATAAAKAFSILKVATAFFGGPGVAAVGVFAAAVAALALRGDDATSSIEALEKTLRQLGSVNAEIEGDTKRLKSLNDELTAAIYNQDEAVAAVKRAELAALDARINKNKELQRVYAATARAQLAQAQAALEASEDPLRPDAARRNPALLVTEEEFREFGSRAAAANAIGFEELERRLDKFADRELDRINARVAAGEALTAQEREVLDKVAERAEAEARVLQLREQLAALDPSPSINNGRGPIRPEDQRPFRFDETPGRLPDEPAPEVDEAAAKRAAKEIERALNEIQTAYRQTFETERGRGETHFRSASRGN